MFHARDDAGAPAPRFFDILYAEDFDDPLPAETAEPPAEPEPPLTRDDLDAACAAAVEAARQDWEVSNHRQQTELLARIGAALTAAGAQAERSALETAEGTVTAMLAILLGALPRLASEYGPSEVRALVSHLLPSLRAEPRVTIRVHADLVHELKRSLAEIEHEMAGTVIVLAAPLQRGDVKVTWDNGAMTRDTRQIHQAMQDALGILGLQQPIETSPKRRMAHAE